MKGVSRRFQKETSIWEAMALKMESTYKSLYKPIQLTVDLSIHMKSNR